MPPQSATISTLLLRRPHPHLRITLLSTTRVLALPLTSKRYFIPLTTRRNRKTSPIVPNIPIPPPPPAPELPPPRVYIPTTTQTKATKTKNAKKKTEKKTNPTVLEAERKFLPTATSLSLLRERAKHGELTLAHDRPVIVAHNTSEETAAAGPVVQYKGREMIRDVYFDPVVPCPATTSADPAVEVHGKEGKNTLMGRNVYLRLRNGGWEIKHKISGDAAGGTLAEEIVGVEAVYAFLLNLGFARPFLARLTVVEPAGEEDEDGGDDMNKEMKNEDKEKKVEQWAGRAVSDFLTTRDIFRVDEYTVVIDDVEFLRLDGDIHTFEKGEDKGKGAGCIIGEVELVTMCFSTCPGPDSVTQGETAELGIHDRENVLQVMGRQIDDFMSQNRDLFPPPTGGARVKGKLEVWDEWVGSRC